MMELNVVLYLLIIQCWGGGLPNVLPKTMHVLCVDLAGLTSAL